jgi:hypothetical protein
MFQMTKQSYGEEALGHSAMFKWHKRFAQGRESWEDDEHTGRPRTVRTEIKTKEVAALVHANRSEIVMKSQQQQQVLAMVLATKFCLMT